MASVKFVAVSRGVKEIMEYVTNKEKTVDRLITGVNCVAQTAVQEFDVVKKQFRKTDGRSYYHIVQAFSPEDKLDFETAHEIGLELAGYFQGFQAVVATHMNTAHKHNHIILNSVNFENGKKFHQSAKELAQVKEFSNRLCQQHGLSIIEVKADPFAIPLWKKKLRKTIKNCMEQSYDRADFVRYMEMLGYKVKWEESHKYITYTTPEGYACRDSKLFDQTLRRERMEEYFAMGGKEYLDSRIAWRELGEPVPTLDDAVCGLASIFEALAVSDNNRFHLETVHHSEEEIQRMLARGRKVERTAEYAVDDEQDEEFEQYHGFSMRM
ncbi:relaxase/mobilization nuclease domain-containing protein [Lacrimispora defluvii]|uniref:Relaxase/mobilization nuclease domain-containing protein n=1 Tax=Lacrimispora defluvii TaxID=2719233 RepID=A0ABX1VV31_9FIRM|nr:relaxase/mobilization nuclease domain-containing protein [Lacrimispora defluvii]NNJ32264.1 relaxase/mobilization nuclease domain-containing protein [Lacrimispora defluvii]